MKNILFVVLISTIFIFSACGPSIKEETNPDDIPSYPAPSSINESYPSPVQIPDSYPGPTPITPDENKRFTISEPLKVGSIEIMGTGPANTPIKVINISFVGEVIGNGVVGQDGTFLITLSNPLEANHIIGLQLSDTSLEPAFLDGPDYTNIPMIGLVLTQAVVQP